MTLVDLGKRVLPSSLKGAVELAVREAGRATADLRPFPDFLVIGTKRGGTTSLWRMLLEHPQVMPMVPAAKNLKSPAFLVANWRRGERWYRGHFPTVASRARHARRHGRARCGEASPAYLWDPRAAERARALMPDARVVILLRDPVTRAWSHWQERIKEGVETLGFEAAVAAEEGRLRGELDRMLVEPDYASEAYDWYSYRSRGVYVEQVDRWLRAYPRDQVLVCRSEDFYAEPHRVFGRITDFIGLDQFAPDPRHFNASQVPASGMAPPIKAALRAFYEPHNQRLADLLGTEVWWPA